MRKRHLVLKLMAVAVLSTTLTILPAARADFLSDFYSEAGAAMNYTASGAYQTQAGTAYVGPSVSIRVPPKNLHPFSVTPPSLKAGCGQIDAIAGAFGFVNETQLVNFIRNIGQAAPAYFFQLAMRSVAPEIAATLDVLNDLAQKMNAFGMNSCQALTTAFGSVIEQNDAESRQRAANWKVEMATAADNFVGNFSLQTNFKDRYVTEQARLAANTPGMKNAGGNPTNPTAVYNVVWNSLKQVSGLDFANTSEHQYMRMMMSLTGTLVSRYDPATSPDDTPPTLEWIPPTITDLNQLLGQLTGPTTIRLLACNTDDTCDDPTPNNETVTRGLLRMVSDDLGVLRDSIVAKSITDPVAYNNALAILGLTPIPVYRIVAASTRGSFASLSDTMLNHIAEVVAIDIASAYILRAMSDLAKAVATGKARTSGIKEAEAEKVLAQIDKVRTQVNAQRAVAADSAGRVFSYIQQVEHLERSFYANASTQIAANLRFGQR
jgi:conjugative transfer pilus assembly protein TraH